MVNTTNILLVALAAHVSGLAAYPPRLANAKVVRGASEEQLASLRELAMDRVGVRSWGALLDAVEERRMASEGRRGLVEAFEAPDAVRAIFEPLCLGVAAALRWQRPGSEFSLNDVQLCAYGVGDYFARHLDDETRGRQGRRRLTTVLALSDAADYRGGELELDGELIRLEAGEAAVFEAGSCWHAVRPVESGLRVSLVFGLFWNSDPATVLLDRDGVVNRDVGSPGVVRVDQLQVFDGVADAIVDLRRRGHRIVLVTNQSAVRKGELARETLDIIHRDLLRQLGAQRETDDDFFDKIIYATGLDDDTPQLKPAPDMLLRALEQEVTTRAVAVGDSENDVVAAHRAGVPVLLVTSSHHGRRCLESLRLHAPSLRPTTAVDDLDAAAATLQKAIEDRRPRAYLRCDDDIAPVAAVFDSAPVALRTLALYLATARRTRGLLLAL
ncbi:hypothetical protein CTAYLR_000298 [Chrysophaeum taylorii]|uniref:Fe2OG dioxygenase domain-containing protein n=1 Tax=Chrysophaeum taylorii TaxID=2483200 RepID=A0AAD7XPN7_9STRA|nr:hypothetical protein CTAYLR_000298 [Chrysophaeum taylorii]